MPRKAAVSSRKETATHFANGSLKPKRWLPDTAEWGGFINVRMDDEELAAFDQWVTAFGDETWSWTMDSVAEGLKLSLAYDAENQSWIATFTGKGMPDLAERFSMSARGGTEAEAVNMLTYKHRVLANEDWSGYRPKTMSFSKRG